MTYPRKRRLSRQDFKTLGARPGLQVVRYNATGERAVVHQLQPEGSERKKKFAMRLSRDSDDSKASEGA